MRFEPDNIQDLDDDLFCLDEFADQFGYKTQETRGNNKILSINEEIGVFNSKLKENQFNFKKFWTCYSSLMPRLFTQAKRTNVISSTSVPSESGFSISGYLQRKERSRMKSRTLRFLMVSSCDIW